MNRNIRTAIFAAALLFCFGRPTVCGDILPAAAGLLPPETVLLLEVDDFAQLEVQFKKTDFYALYTDPSMAAFFENARTKWQGQVRQFDDDLPRTILQTGLWPKGRAAFALIFNSRAKVAGEPFFLFITQWGDHIARIRAAFDEMAAKAVNQGAHLSTEEYRGVTIVTITKELEPIEVPDYNNFDRQSNTMPTKKVARPPSKLCCGFVDDCLIGCDDVETLKFTIAHIKGAAGTTLAEQSCYASTTKAVGPYRDISVFVNIGHLVKTAVADDAGGEAAKLIKSFGFDNVTALVGVAGLARSPQASFEARMLLKVEGSKKGICKMLDMQSAPFVAPAFLADSTYWVAFFNIDIRNAFDELANVLNSLSPQAAAVLYTPPIPDSPDGEPGVQLRRDIIQNLGSQVLISQTINKPFTTGAGSVEMLFAAAVNNRPALEKSLSRLHGELIAPNAPQARRELLGHTIYLLKPPFIPGWFGGGLRPLQQPTEPAADKTSNLAFTITDTHLIIGLESTVERAIRSLRLTDARSIGSAEWFSRARTAAPSAVGLACLQDSRASAEFFWWMAKQKEQAKTFGMFMLGGQAFSDLFDGSLLPDFDVVRKYFGSSVVYELSRPEGFFFEFKNLKPVEISE